MSTPRTIAVVALIGARTLTLKSSEVAFYDYISLGSIISHLVRYDWLLF